MNRRGFLGLLAGIAAAAIVPVKSNRQPGCATGISAALSAKYEAFAKGEPAMWAYVVSDASRSFQGFNTRDYPTLTAKIL